MEAIKDGTHLYEVERRAEHAARPGFRITEIQLSKTQKVPWHYHNNVQDTFYVLNGNLRLFLRDPKEEIRLAPGDTYSVKPRRPHLVANGGGGSATFLVLQGIGEYDFFSLLLRLSPSSPRVAPVAPPVGAGPAAGTWVFCRAGQGNAARRHLPM